MIGCGRVIAASGRRTPRCGMSSVQRASSSFPDAISDGLDASSRSRSSICTYFQPKRSTCQEPRARVMPAGMRSMTRPTTERPCGPFGAAALLPAVVDRPRAASSLGSRHAARSPVAAGRSGGCGAAGRSRRRVAARAAHIAGAAAAPVCLAAARFGQCTTKHDARLFSVKLRIRIYKYT